MTTCAYDLADRLTRISAGSTTTDVTFDALGRFATRTQNTSPDATVDTYAYLLGGSRLGRKIGSGSLSGGRRRSANQPRSVVPARIER